MLLSVAYASARATERAAQPGPAHLHRAWPVAIPEKSSPSQPGLSLVGSVPVWQAINGPSLARHAALNTI